MTETPKIMMFAGPNGSGKSTVTRYLQQQPNFPANYANADEVAQTLTGDPMLQSYEAARMVASQRMIWMNARQSFAFETVMSHPSKLIQLQQAKLLGYRIEIYYVSTADVRYNVLRVRNRVLDGGHDVPANKVIERYERSLKLLPLAIEIATNIALVDNTMLPIELAQGHLGRITALVENCPAWASTAILTVQQRQAARQSLQVAYSNGNSLSEANAWDGQYVGGVTQLHPHYVVQNCDGTFVLHDRLLLQGDYQIGQSITIRYREGVGRSST
jgi:predicted ABC-type ATPase